MASSEDKMNPGGKRVPLGKKLLKVVIEIETKLKRPRESDCLSEAEKEEFGKLFEEICTEVGFPAEEFELVLQRFSFIEFFVFGFLHAYCIMEE
ncbi:hypothetical protein DMENIID0001_134500 [Sergentomyia squamirostris]